MKAIRKIICLLEVLLFSLMVGCAMPSSAAIEPGSLQATTPYVSSGSKGDAPAQLADYAAVNPADYTHIEPWRVAYYQVVAEAVTNSAPALIPMVLRFYTPIYGVPYMQIDYYKTQDLQHSTAVHTRIWHYKENSTVLLYDDAAFINSKFSPLGYFHMANETPIYSNDNRDEANFIELIGLHGETRILHDTLPKEAVPYDDALRLAGDKLTLDTAEQIAMLKDYFLDAYQPPVPAGAPVWVTAYMRYVRTHTPAAYGGVTIDKPERPQVLYLTTLPDAATPPAMHCTIPLVFQQHGTQHWIPYGQLQTLVGHYGGMHGFFVDANGELLIDFHVFSNRSWYRPTFDGLVFLFDGGTFHEDSDGFFYVHHDGLSERFKTREEAERRNEEILATGFMAHGHTLPVEYIEPTPYPLPENTLWPEYEAALVDAFCRHARSIGQWAE